LFVCQKKVVLLQFQISAEIVDKLLLNRDKTGQNEENVPTLIEKKSQQTWLPQKNVHCEW
jgi:hypothetical protein